MLFRKKGTYTIIEDCNYTKSDISILFIASFDNNGIITVKQTIFQYIEFSRFSVDLLNIQEGIAEIPKEVMNKYSAVVIHNTASYFIQNVNLINKLILKKYKGIKVLMKQDEHYQTNKFVDFIHQNKIDLLLTLWDTESANKIYKNGKNQQLHIMQFITGYVPDEYKEFKCNIKHRDIDVGYRGSLQPMLFGRMAYEKHQIGDRFAIEAEQYGLNCDISSRWEDRIYGDDWLSFLHNCKAVLGVESGSSIVDFDGTVGKKYDSYMRHNPDAEEREVLKFLAPYEKDIQYRVIAPRHFEAIACGALQILYEGEYQNILKPYVHYIPLKRDFSNMEEVVEYIKNDEKRYPIIERAFQDIILSERFSFRSFVKEFDDAIISILKEKTRI